jgi:DNA polymerase elongation subunit (family B)
LYEKFDFIFDDFVKNFENLKKKDEIHKKFAKLIINSLYGRMGMNNMEEESLIIKKNDFRIYEKKYRIKSFVELNEIILINIENTIKKKLKKNISIASCITSKARIKLYKAQMDVVKNNGRLLYSDTDSIYASFKEDVSKKKHGIIE